MLPVERTELAPGYGISRLLKGGWHLSSGHNEAVERSQAIADMAAFVEAGFTTFDCADHYLGVEQMAGVRYRRIDAAGLHIEHDGAERAIEADTIVVCAGQVPDDALAAELAVLGKPVHLVGGARLAGELDAQRAIDEGVRLGLTI